MGDDWMVYLVGGDTGEYSDHRAWWVKAFLDKEEAERFCERLNAWVKDRKWDNGNDGYWEFEWDKRPKPPEDPHFEVDYMGTRYSVVEVPVSEAGKFRIMGA